MLKVKRCRIEYGARRLRNLTTSYWDAHRVWRKSIRVREGRLLLSLAVSTFIGEKLLALHRAAETAFDYFAKAGYLHDLPRLPDRHRCRG